MDVDSDVDCVVVGTEAEKVECNDRRCGDVEVHLVGGFEKHMTAEGARRDLQVHTYKIRFELVSTQYCVSIN